MLPEGDFAPKNHGFSMLLGSTTHIWRLCWHLHIQLKRRLSSQRADHGQRPQVLTPEAHFLATSAAGPAVRWPSGQINCGPVVTWPSGQICYGPAVT